MKTRILKVPPGPEPGRFVSSSSSLPPSTSTTTQETAAQGTSSSSSSFTSSLDTWEISTEPAAQAVLAPLREAAALLRESDVPVAFPTETVYGLGADATRSAAVRGIYAAKGRPSDNPLIVHVCDLDMLRGLLVQRPTDGTTTTTTNGEESGDHEHSNDEQDPIPAIYRPLLQRFWPGPLTVLLRLPDPSPLAPETTAGLPTFGARMPASSLARTLVRLAGRPLAAPSANASTRPSPTAASHVADDLGGRIALVLDGGACGVGVESTVVDGLCAPPVVLRPGGVSVAELRAVPGWEGVVKGYRDESEEGKKGEGEAGPRAPGMKYKHYSPRARVVLFEARRGAAAEAVLDELRGLEGKKDVVGIIRTAKWDRIPGQEIDGEEANLDGAAANGDADLGYSISTSSVDGLKVLDIALGRTTKMVAQGLFSALRELDRRGADVIYVEGVEDRDDIAAAVMNRLRKAASEIRA